MEPTTLPSNKAMVGEGMQMMMMWKVGIKPSPISQEVDLFCQTGLEGWYGLRTIVYMRG